MSKTYLKFSVLKIAFPLLQLLQPAGLKGTDGSRRWGSVGSRSASSVPLLFDSLGFLRRDVNESQKKKGEKKESQIIWNARPHRSRGTNSSQQKLFQ